MLPKALANPSFLQGHCRYGTSKRKRSEDVDWCDPEEGRPSKNEWFHSMTYWKKSYILALPSVFSRVSSVYATLFDVIFSGIYGCKVPCAGELLDLIDAIAIRPSDVSLFPRYPCNTGGWHATWICLYRYGFVWTIYAHGLVIYCGG